MLVLDATCIYIDIASLDCMTTTVLGHCLLVVNILYIYYIDDTGKCYYYIVYKVFNMVICLCLLWEYFERKRIIKFLE